ncbi:MAG: polyprenyl synthetase family protein, partial [Armatimonadota bacterium]
EIEELTAALRSTSDQVVSRPHTYLPLLRETSRIFEASLLIDLLPPDIGQRLLNQNNSPAKTTESIALDWLKSQGKRLRPFLTTASYAVATHGSDALAGDFPIAAMLPTPIKRIALAIEALHKASLIHDDIEDEDDYRYGRRTIHKEHGIAPAINVGDYLVGLGYNLVAGEAGSLGAECVADILRSLSSAHLDLCRGQGEELLISGQHDEALRPIDVLSTYALKTAPALEVALYTGLRTANVSVDTDLLRRFCVYLGEGYQIQNDLDDWQPGGTTRITPGGDALAGRPTILRAFALEADGSDIHAMETLTDPEREFKRIRHLYEKLGVFDRAESLVARLRDRAGKLTESFETQALQELMLFLVGLILPGRPTARTGG